MFWIATLTLADISLELLYFRIHSKAIPYIIWLFCVNGMYCYAVDLYPDHYLLLGHIIAAAKVALQNFEQRHPFSRKCINVATSGLMVSVLFRIRQAPDKWPMPLQFFYSFCAPIFVELICNYPQRAHV